jgi:VWFA-related protein
VARSTVAQWGLSWFKQSLNLDKGATLKCTGILALIFSVLSAGFVEFARAQTPTAGDVHSGSDRSIVLDVVVTDKSGKPVSDLQEQDFTLLDNKHPQKILSFQVDAANSRTEDSSLQVIFLIDAVNTTFSSVANLRLQLNKFLKQDGGRLSLPSSLATMTDTSQGVTESTRVGNILAEMLDSSQSGLRVIGRSQGFYGGQDQTTRMDIR